MLTPGASSAFALELVLPGRDPEVTRTVSIAGAGGRGRKSSGWCGLNTFRAVATRYDKRAYVVHGTVTVAAIQLWLRP